MVDLNKLREEITLLQNNIQTLKTKTTNRLTVTNEIEKKVQAYLAKNHLLPKKRQQVGVVQQDDTTNTKEDGENDTEPQTQEMNEKLKAADNKGNEKNSQIMMDEGKEASNKISLPAAVRFHGWAQQFRRADPRYQILNFFNDVAEEGTRSLSQKGFNRTSLMPLMRAFYKSSVFTVWRPTSYDAIRKMILGEGVGKGLDIKGKSAKRGKLSGFVPFLQIHQEEHKLEVHTLRKDGRIRVFYNSKQDQDRVVKFLEEVAKEMVDTVKKARAIVEDYSIEDEDTNEWALSKLIWDMNDSSIRLINDYAPQVFGIEVPERLFWEGLVVRQDIHREANSVDDVGRASVPSFQDMNFAALRPQEENPNRQAVILRYKGHDCDGIEEDPLDPRSLLMAYEEGNRVMPVVSDFDCFTVGTRGVQYDKPLPDDQVEVSKWCVDHIESILEFKPDGCWTSRWLDVLKNAASSGFYPSIPLLGFSDPKSHSIMENAIHRLQKEGSVRHGAECFNYYFPQDLDEEYLVISDRLPGTSLPWKYVDQQGLREILMEKIDLGYTFPINPKWVLCDPGWKDVLDKLVASKADHVQESLKAWYPPQSGLLEKIEDIHKRFPRGFLQGVVENDRNEGTEAMDLAELELKNFMTLKRAKRKLRGYLIWRRLLDQLRRRRQKSSQVPEGESVAGGGHDEKDDGRPEIADTPALKAEDLKATRAGTNVTKQETGKDDSLEIANKVSEETLSKQPDEAAKQGLESFPTTLNTTRPRLIRPLEMVINPDSNILDRPLVALTMAVLTNTDVDLTLRSDQHCSHQAVLGVEITNGDGLPLQIVGDLAMARYLVRRSQMNEFANLSMPQQAEQDAWIDYAQSLKPLSWDQKQKAVGMTLGHALVSRTYVVGESMTMADVALFVALGWPCQATEFAAVADALKKEYPPAFRWVNMIAFHPAVQKVTQLAMGVDGTTEVSFGSPQLDPLIPGIRLLEGAVPGSVVTRFSLDHTGHLHVGHIKAVLLNDYYARRYKGRLIVRFDDTNPSKEKDECHESIMDDLKVLGVEPDVFVYTSDYFPTIRRYAIQMIEKGQAYMDDTSMEQINQERASRIASKHRNQTPDEAKEKFILMSSGKKDGAAWCLRAKIDMDSDIWAMRDPVLFRQNLDPHHRTGTTYKAYPTYAFACPVVDSLEGVTHALRIAKFHDHASQYQWIQSTLGLRRVRIQAFSRINFMFTVLSKSKLKWFIEQGLVEGWEDARFPTVRGLLRRGANLDALKNFIYSQGVSNRAVNMNWSKFWTENKKEIDKQAKRFMVIDANHHVPLKVTNGPAVDANVYLSTACHPRDQSLGSRALRIGQDVILESTDVDGMEEGDEIVLVRWGLVKITKITMAEDGHRVGSLEGVLIPNGESKMAKRNLLWVVATGKNPIVELTEFDHLLTKCTLEEEDSLEENANRNNVAVTYVLGDSGLKTLQEHDIVKLDRGYFRVDSPYRGEGKSIVLYMIPDGKSKPMP